MPSFADSFWSDDLTKGVETLFAQLHEGCFQNDIFIQLFASRMQQEVAHGQQLCNIRSGIDQFDEGKSTITKALHEIIGHMTDEGSQHINIASTIETTVLAPFSSWSEEHRKRVEYSEQKLKKHLAKFTKSRKQVEKLEQTYFNKCRTLEDFKRENFSDQELVAAMEALELYKAHSLTVEKEKEVLEFGKFASIAMDYRSTRQLLKALLVELPKHEYKVPFINYIIQNTNNGSEITKFISERMNLTDLDQAEAFGQDLLNKGFLKYCNGVSSHFANSKKFQYQWKAYAYEFARLPRPGTDENEIDDEHGYVHARPASETNRFSAYIQDITSRITNSDSQTNTDKSVDESLESVGSSGPHLTEQQRSLLKLRNEVEVADYNYRRECTKQDSLRCTMEELIIDHYTFMEKCEKDRLEAVKKATLDFCAALGNKISSMKIIVEKMITSESSMDPVRDILNLVETHSTGFFQPKVVPYNNYYNPGGYQNFGIDLETRCRLDKKVVPLIVSTILSYMDEIYPEMEDDEARTKAWTEPVKLQETHRLRKLLNEKPAKSEAEILEIIKSSNSSPSLVTSVLKVYLLELPSPLIPDEIYDVMKSMYSEFPPGIPGKTVREDQETIDSQRIKCITSTLSSLSKPRIATLDAITTHFYRLIKILKMSDSEASKSLADALVINISQEFANCIIKIKQPDGNDLGYKIFFDLITYKKDVFRDLKRHGSRRKSENTSNSDNVRS